MDTPSRPGAASPLGVTLGPTVEEGGTRFRFLSRHAERLVLSLREADGSVRERPLARTSGDDWEVFVPGVGPGQRYAVRAFGPYLPAEGHRFDPRLPLLDPAARAVTWSSGFPEGLVVEDAFDWEDDAPPARPWSETVVYELHVRGFTRHPSSGVAHPGTFRGLAEKAHALVELGVTAVELLPVFAWHRFDAPRRHPRTGALLSNYWGYAPLSFFAPAEHLAGPGPPGHAVREFREMVRALHRAGLEVLLDVVYNHTGEGGEGDRTYGLRGLDNAGYYHLDPRTGRYRDYTGCGNTLAADGPLGRRLIVESLRYWAAYMHVDGFRFDLASALTRDHDGALGAGSLLAELVKDPIVGRKKLISEPWDAAGGYQLGAAPAGFAEWNGQFRDDVRRFWHPRQKAGLAELVTRLCGSSDVFAPSKRGPLASLNFVTCHDGFTLRDFTSYDRKHNAENGEDNRDGSPNEGSYNHGVEGDSDDPQVTAARLGTMRALFATLLLSQGVPMLLGGDERFRTQRGNNNAYCHDDERSWIDWSPPPLPAQPLAHLVRDLLSLRRRFPALRRATFFTGRDHDGDGRPDVQWRLPDGSAPKWENGGRAIAGVLSGAATETGAPFDHDDLLLLVNGGGAEVRFELPRTPGGGHWFRLVDTALGISRSVGEGRAEEPIEGRYALGRGVALFAGHRRGKTVPPPAAAQKPRTG